MCYVLPCWKNGEEHSRACTSTRSQHSSSTLLIPHSALWYPTTHRGSMTASPCCSALLQKWEWATSREGVIIEAGTLVYGHTAPQSLQSQARPKPTNAAASFYHHRLRNRTPESDTVPALSTMLPWSAVEENVQKR